MRNLDVRKKALLTAALPPVFFLLFAATAHAQSLKTWTEENLTGWWKEHPDPASWRAGKADLLEALREAQVRNGTQRAMENEHFVGWVGHLVWLRAFPGDDAGHAYFGTEEGRETYLTLSLKKVLPALLASSLAPEDDAMKAVENLCRIAQAHPDTVDKFPALAVAIAVVFDRPFSGSWPHPFVKQEEVASGDLEVERRFRFFVECHEKRLLMHPIDRLSVKELTYLVDSLLKFDEYRWAQQIKIDQPAHLASLYRLLSPKYDFSRSSQADYSWPHGRYSLVDIYEKGSICMDQAWFIAETGKSRGVPTVLFIGQGRSGGHAWVGYLKDRGEWELDVARIREEKYPVGAMYDPQTWRRMTDAQFRFVMGDLMKTGNYQRAQQALQWAAMNRDEPFYREVLAYARTYMSRYFVIWELEAEWLEKSDLPPKEKETFWKSWITNFRTETDMKIQGQVRLLKFYQAQNDTRAAERLQNEILVENESKRFDLAITIAWESILGFVTRGDWENAEKEFDASMERFEKNAGGHLFYNLVEPFVERCMENGRKDLARKALRAMKEIVKAAPNSLLDADIVKLEKVVG